MKIIFILLLSINSVYAAVQEFTFPNKKVISIDLPQNYKSVKEFLTIPLTVFGPFRDGKRPVFSVSPLNLKDVKFDPRNLSATQQFYFAGRKEWLSKQAGAFKEKINYSVENWKYIKNVQAIGFLYKLRGENFKEQTYYFNCHNELFHVTTLETNAQVKSVGAEFKRTLHSLKCL